MSEIKQYPLTVTQQLLMYANKFIFDKAWLNVASCISINEDIDPEIMLNAIKQTMMRNEFTKIRFHKKFMGPYSLYFCDNAPEGIELVDFSALSEAELNKTLEKWARRPFAHKCMDVQMYDLKLILKADGKYCIYANFCHYGFDSYPIMQLINYISKMYVALKNGTELPPESGSPISMYESEYAYNGSEQHKADIDFWTNYFDPADEPYFTNFYGKDGKFSCKGKRYGRTLVPFKNKSVQLNLKIPADTVNKIERFATQNRISPQSVHYLALHTYLSTKCDSDDVLGSIAVARRSKLIQKHGGGSMVNSIMVRNKIDRATVSVTDAAKQINAELNNCFKHANMMAGDVIENSQKCYNIPVGYHYFTCTLCYQPYFDTKSLSADMTFARLNNGAAPQSLYITVMACDSSGDLTVNYESAEVYYPAEVLEEYHNFLCKFLDDAMDNPDTPIGKIAEKYI